ITYTPSRRPSFQHNTPHTSGQYPSRSLAPCGQPERPLLVTPGGQRRELPWVAVDKQYRFDTDAGTKTLAGLFDGRSSVAFTCDHYGHLLKWTSRRRPSLKPFVLRPGSRDVAGPEGGTESDRRW